MISFNDGAEPKNMAMAVVMVSVGVWALTRKLSKSNKMMNKRRTGNNPFGQVIR